jgi:hypothetical protein
MKTRNFISILFGCLFATAAALAVFCCVRFADARPILLAAPESARNRIVIFMDAFCGGNFEEAGQSILGVPELGLDKEPQGEVAELLWNAYLDSMSYELIGECCTTEKGIAQTVLFTGLSLDQVTADWNQRARELLEQRVAEAENTSDVYDEQNEYREDFIMAVLYDAASAALAENAALVSRELTVELQYQAGQWWVVADKELLDALFGGIL